MKKFFTLCLALLCSNIIRASEKNSNLTHEIGGFINVRATYQFAGITDNIDMVTYDIPIPGDYATKSMMNFDCSTSRLFLKSTLQTKALGEITGYIETDFRGDNTTLSLRQCYISFDNLLIGQSFTTFCDLGASPTTIDFQGPNSYNADFSIMVRYSQRLDERWSMAASVEMPQLSMTATSNLLYVPQTIPDIILWGEYTWGESHLRASGVVRNMRYYNQTQDKYKITTGWGAQITGKINITKKLITYMQAVYGHGITLYVQDLYAVGLDLVENPKDANKLQTLPAFGFFWTFQYDFTEKLFAGFGYSMVNLFSQNDYSKSFPSTYKWAQYFFANVFYELAPSCQIGFEYLMGSRENFNHEHNSANRLNAMIQYNF